MMDSTLPPSGGALHRSDSISQASEASQTAQDYIASQLTLEAEAREALPYQFDSCTKLLGPLRQTVYACLTCTPPPASQYQQFTPAGICYSCSISCHGEHNLVELFTKRDFVCDCGTTRLGDSGTPCMLRLNTATRRKGGVVGEEARAGNKYSQNFQGKFCACGEEYDPEKEKGTMFQCLGLGSVEDGGCGEDWWHPECLMGLPRHRSAAEPAPVTNGGLDTVKEEGEEEEQSSAITGENAVANGPAHDEVPPPQGFPDEDEFDHLICFKCTNAFPWIKQYAGQSSFLTAKPASGDLNGAVESKTNHTEEQPECKKRRAEDDLEDTQDSKKIKPLDEPSTAEPPIPTETTKPPPKHASLAAAQDGNVALYLKEDFRDQFCRCAECFPRLAKHPQLLEEEESYEPPLSESDAGGNDNGSIGGRSVNSGSLLDRGEAALSSMDRVRAIEGVMAYNHVRDKVKAFLQPFAESGQPVGAEDIKAYFAKLRGDEQAMRQTVAQAEGSGEADHRREQGGY